MGGFVFIALYAGSGPNTRPALRGIQSADSTRFFGSRPPLFRGWHPKYAYVERLH
nr:MAG TPA: hypothetical protein [Caudoviricetes sp.]